MRKQRFKLPKLMTRPLISWLGSVLSGTLLLSPSTLFLFETRLLSQTFPQTFPRFVASEAVPSPNSTLIDRELFFADPDVDSPQLSPDGQYLAFRKPANGVMNLWVKPLNATMEQAVALTAQASNSIPFFVWSADGKTIIYGQDTNGNENFQLYRVFPLEALGSQSSSPTSSVLTPFETIQARIYAVPRATPNHIVVGMNDRDPRFHDVYRLDLRTGNRSLLYEVNDSITDWTVDPDGNLRLATRETNRGITEILVYDNHELTPVYNCSLLESCAVIGLQSDQNQVYISTNKGDDQDLTHLIRLDLKTQEIKLISSDPDAEVDFGGAIFSAEGQTLLGTFYVGDRLRVYPTDQRLQQDWRYLQSQFPGQDVFLGALTEEDQRVVLNEQRILVNVRSDRNPGSVYLFDRQQRSLNKIYDTRPGLNAHELAEMEPIRYTARDGTQIPGYLTLPIGLPPQKLPTIVMPHRGPWGKDTWQFNPYAQFLANRGYAVLQPNYRGSAGYGQAFLNAGNQTWGTGIMQHDVTDGVHYLIEQGIADPERIGIFGDSYGGYATLAGLAFTPDLYAAGVSLSGPSNLLTLLATIPPYWAPIREMFAIRLGSLDNPADRERLQQQSPLFSAHRIQAPLLVLQGANDPRVAKQEADQMVVALRDLGKPVDYLLAEDEGHGFRKEENLVAAMAALEQFFAQHLGGRFQDSMSPATQHRLERMKVDIETLTLEVSAP